MFGSQQKHEKRHTEDSNVPKKLKEIQKQNLSFIASPSLLAKKCRFFAFFGFPHTNRVEFRSMWGVRVRLQC